MIRILVATDAWYPQLNGVVHTLSEIARVAEPMGATLSFLTSEGLPTVPLPSYPSIRLALPYRRTIVRRIEAARPDAIHIATEGPIGLMARAYCVKNGFAFTTSFHTRFAEYVAARTPIVPDSWTWGLLRRFHNAGAGVMAATPALMLELASRGFRNVMLWPRGVNAELFRPRPGADLGLPRPVFLTVGRLAVEKNTEAFLRLDLPGTKVVVGDGPARGELAQRFPDVVFLGAVKGEALARVFAAADVFVFPSLTDTFGLVLLEALASGVPVAAFSVPGPRDVIGEAAVGALDSDLGAACRRALTLSRAAAREFALSMTWERSARAFVANAVRYALLPAASGQLVSA
jgi:glycosyltransferase involved in cell wall biosynthesis